ncbi:putative sugar nucleotidyl transferase [Planctomicrobium sp. SH661]|uniref:putative sugar nucleotidyl transferase n=1 Tax=Planctomicrobium sp. SH661 TaxID=3448124 RepID=UPI003F5C932D
MRRIAFFEDQTARQFAPIALLRPVFELLCGHFSARERLCIHFPTAEWGAVLRPELQETYQLEHPAAHLNDQKWLGQDDVLLVNGRCLIQPHLLESLTPGTAAWIGETLAAISISPTDKCSVQGILQGDELVALAKRKSPVQVEGTVLDYPWDLIAENPGWLTRDFAAREKQGRGPELDSRVAIVGSPEQVFIHPTARLDPFVVIDASAGPVWIDREVRIQAFTRIEGPAYIGQKTQLFRANIREGCSFGPVCRLGGEIEESIVHGYANKYHDGFLGHSYVCPWVNLGALTTNSDLKNDYSNVSVPLSGDGINSGSTKVGCFIGDHTKTALCSLFNTGSSIGVMSLILPGGELLPKHIPSFSRVWHGRIEEIPGGTDSGIQSARIAMSRRGMELDPAAERLLKHLFSSTAQERARAISRGQ